MFKIQMNKMIIRLRYIYGVALLIPSNTTKPVIIIKKKQYLLY